ncbi:unnamed protein product, partial [Amoebophrya sp. A120]
IVRILYLDENEIDADKRKLLNLETKTSASYELNFGATAGTCVLSRSGLLQVVCIMHFKYVEVNVVKLSSSSHCILINV